MQKSDDFWANMIVVLVYALLGVLFGIAVVVLTGLVLYEIWRPL